MYRHFLLVMGLLGATVFVSPPAHSDTAEEMASFCEPYRHAVIVDATMNGPLIQVPGANANSEICWGAFGAIQELGVLVLAPGASPALNLCSLLLAAVLSW